jgi:hypothetical protein
MKEAEAKINFIILWYNQERVKFSFSKQITLANTWMEICTKNEEYEMASALKKEREKIVKDFISKKRKSRNWKQKLKFYCVTFLRKFK